MTPEQFCYWLQGAFETMDEGRGLSQFDHTVRDHLNTVFHKVTPNYTTTEPLREGPHIPFCPQPPEGPVSIC